MSRRANPKSGGVTVSIDGAGRPAHCGRLPTGADAEADGGVGRFWWQ